MPLEDGQPHADARHETVTGKQTGDNEDQPRQTADTPDTRPVTQTQSTHTRRTASPQSSPHNSADTPGSRVKAWFLARLWSLIYVALALPSGLLIIFCDRFDWVNDSAAHWQRCLHLALGDFHMPADPARPEIYGYTMPNGRFYALNNVAVNSPFAYLPGWVSGLLFGQDRQAACVCTLIFCLLAVAIAIRKARGLWAIIFGVACLPAVFITFTFPPPTP